jgi:hypothetical protein
VAPFSSDERGAVAYWRDTGESFIATQSPLEEVCVAEASLQQGELCNSDTDCAFGLVCHEGYTPSQCQPRSSNDQHCSFDTDCVSGNCDLPRREDGSYDPAGNSCALADPSCDIRVDPTCGHWLSCQLCKPAYDPTLPGPAAPDAAAPDAGAPDAAR